MLTATVLLAIGLARKVRRLLTTGGNEDALTSWLASRGIRPRIALSLATFAEMLVITLIYVDPIGGLIALVLLMLVYSALLSRLPAGEDCGCFGELIPATNRAAIIRNIILSVAAAVGAAIAAVHDVRPHLLGQVPIGVTLIVLAGVVGFAHANRVLSPALTEMSRR